MAVPTGTFQTYQAIGNREDLSDMIYDISPTDTPFMSNIDRGSCDATLCEWQTDELETAAVNKHVEGDDDTADVAAATLRLGNYTQISKKIPRVAGTQIAVNSAGRKNEMAYQIAKRGKELKRDMEVALAGTQEGIAGSASVARQLAGAAMWMWDNTVEKNVAADTAVVTAGVPTTPIIPGTTGAFAEADLKTLLAKIWVNGGDPDLVLVGEFNKQSASAFAGIATQYRENPQVGPATIIGSADVYVSDWGQVNIVADRFSPVDNVYALDTRLWEVKYLRSIQQRPLSKTGDSERRELLAEYTLCNRNPRGSGKVYTTTSA